MFYLIVNKVLKKNILAIKFMSPKYDPDPSWQNLEIGSRPKLVKFKLDLKFIVNHSRYSAFKLKRAWNRENESE